MRPSSSVVRRLAAESATIGAPVGMDARGLKLCGRFIGFPYAFDSSAYENDPNSTT
jgi:hypothetical protein